MRWHIKKLIIYKYILGVRKYYFLIFVVGGKKVETRYNFINLIKKSLALWIGV